MKKKLTQVLTPWFPAKAKPARAGVYEVHSDRFRAFAYWDGSRFGWRSWAYMDELAEAIHSAHAMRNQETCLSATASWRGLAEQPK